MLGLLGLVETCLHCSFSCSPYSSITRWTKLGPRDVVVTRLFSTKDFTLPSVYPFFGCKKFCRRRGCSYGVNLVYVSLVYIVPEALSFPYSPRRGPIGPCPLWDTSGVADFEFSAWGLNWLCQACVGSFQHHVRNPSVTICSCWHPYKTENLSKCSTCE